MQGVDLYSRLRARLIPALELHTYLLNLGHAPSCRGDANYTEDAPAGHWVDESGSQRPFPPVTLSCRTGWQQPLVSSPLLCGGATLKLGSSGTREALLRDLLQTQSQTASASASQSPSPPPSASVSDIEGAEPMPFSPDSKTQAEPAQASGRRRVKSARGATVVRSPGRAVSLPPRPSTSPTVTPTQTPTAARGKLVKWGRFPSRGARNATNTFEIALSGYTRLGMPMLHTAEFVRTVVHAQRYPSDIYMHVFEPLTHGEVPADENLPLPFSVAPRSLSLADSFAAVFGAEEAPALAALSSGRSSLLPLLSPPMLRWPLVLFPTGETAAVPAKRGLGFKVTAVVSLSLAQSCISERLLQLLPSHAELDRTPRPAEHAAENVLPIPSPSETPSPSPEQAAGDPSDSLSGVPAAGATAGAAAVTDVLADVTGPDGAAAADGTPVADLQVQEAAAEPLPAAAVAAVNSNASAALVQLHRRTAALELQNPPSVAAAAPTRRLLAKPASALKPSGVSKPARAGARKIPSPGKEDKGGRSKGGKRTDTARSRHRRPKRRPRGYATAAEADVALGPAWEEESGDSVSSPVGWPPASARRVRLSASLRLWLRGSPPIVAASVRFPLSLLVVSDAACARAGASACVLLGRDVLLDTAHPAGMLLHLLVQGGGGALGGAVVDPGATPEPPLGVYNQW